MPLQLTVMNEAPYSAAALQHLDSLREHDCAPSYNFVSSDLLDHARLTDVRNFAKSDSTFWAEGARPEWLSGLVKRVYEQVPFYRRMGDAPNKFEDIPPISRQELAEHPELLIPDNMGLEELTVYTTSGTTGTSLKIPTDPALSSKTLVLMERLMKSSGARFPRGAEKVALASIFLQESTLTYPSLSHYLDGAATLKLNLHPRCWKNPKDRAAFLNDVSPAVVAGCPFSLQALTEIVPELSLSAIFSSATPMNDGLRNRLREVYGCPVYDVYSLTEVKFIAAKSEGEGHDLISGDLFVEILDAEGRVCAAGERGEITVSGGRNKYLPLLRYRTGDYASLCYRGEQPYLCELQGRAEARFVNGRGEAMPSLDITNALREFPLVGFSFAQSRDGRYRLKYCGRVDQSALSRALKEQLEIDGEVVLVEDWSGKPQQFKGL